jgi:hypothetical protein
MTSWQLARKSLVCIHPDHEFRVDSFDYTAAGIRTYLIMSLFGAASFDVMASTDSSSTKFKQHSLYLTDKSGAKKSLYIKQLS